MTEKVDSTSQQVTQAGQSATSAGLDTQKQAAGSAGSTGVQESGVGGSAGNAVGAVAGGAQTNKMITSNKPKDANAENKIKNAPESS